jgi:branched-subunit amino acid ABC-type transport system permease component
VDWVNAVVQGILLGGVYALMACGLSLMFGVMRIINLAHGDLAVVGAYLILVVLDHSSVSPFLAFVIILPAMLLIGYVLQVVILDRSLRGGLLTPILATFGLSIAIQNVLLKEFSPDSQSFGGQAGSIVTDSWQVTGQISISALGALTLLVAVVVIGALHLFLTRTRRGAIMRATAQDVDVAGLVGINARAVYASATAVAVAVAALAGLFVGLRSSFTPNAGPSYLLFAFEAVVIGGLGSLWGTLLGGVALGVAQTLGEQYNTQYSFLAGHLLFLAVLATRRGGLLVGREATA